MIVLENDEYNKVKYYSENDFSIIAYFERIEEVISNFSLENKVEDINSIIEIYNIQLFFKNNVYSIEWNNQQIEDYRRIVNRFSKIIGRYFSEINMEVLISQFDKVHFHYTGDFWLLLEKYKIYEKISTEHFKTLLLSKSFHLEDILKCKKIVCFFGSELVAFMEGNPDYAELILNNYLIKHNQEKDLLFFPKEFSNEKKSQILEKYILSQSPNMNYLKLIFESNSIKDLCLSDRLKLKAKQKYDEFLDKLFIKNPGIESHIQVGFSDKINDMYSFNHNGGRDFSAIYNLKWIKENLDYPTLLNNFIFLFEYTDLQYRSQHVLRESQLGIFEKILGLKAKRGYYTGIAFQFVQDLAQLQIIAYCKELEKYNIDLEEIIEWFFCSYLKEEFNIIGFYFHKSSRNVSYLEKCRNMAAEIDSILKQYKILCEDGEINRKLLSISTEHIFIKNIPSMLVDKYVYPHGDDFNTASYLLFSSQSRIFYIPEFQNNYKSFYQLIENEILTYDMFAPHQTTGIDWLIKHDLLIIDVDKKIIPCKEKIFLLKELYEHKVLSFSYIKKFNSTIEELKNSGMVRFASSLFSKPEQDYYNYLFNKSEFDNGLDIRNRYIHGTQSIDKEQNEMDYYIFLRIMILIVLKINEEFCLKYPIISN